MTLPNTPVSLGLHSKKFADKVRVMNQTNSKNLMLTNLEAQNLLNDIFDLLTQIAALSVKREEPTITKINVKGGGF